MSLRAVRSPDAPKMTRHAGSGVRARRRPSRSGLLRVTVTAVSAWRARVTRRVGSSRARVEPAMREDAVEQGRPGEFRASEDPEPRQDPRPPGRDVAMNGSLLYRVTPELVAQRGRDLHRIGVVLARREAREERMREYRRGDVVRDRFLDRPAPLTRVRDPAFDVREVRAFLLEGAFGELEEPRPHDAALQPHRGDALHIDVELAGVDELEAFAVGLHHPVLDPVVDHLYEVARAALSEVGPAVRRRERIEHRLHALDRASVTADHHAVAVLEPPYAAGDSDVEKVESERAVFLRTPDRVAEIGVRTVDQDVSLRGVLRELVERVIRGLTRRHHRPQDAW